MTKLKKLEISKEKLENLPLFYSNVLYNELIPSDPFYYTKYSKKFESIIQFMKSDKQISKIIDFSNNK
jgi:hypothetical protein